MSVINKMLQDLDKRGAEPTGGKIHEVEPIEIRDEPRSRGGLYAGIAVVGVALLGAGYWFFGPKLMRGETVAMQPTKAAPVPQPAKPPPPVVPSSAPSPAEKAAPEATQPTVTAAVAAPQSQASQPSTSPKVESAPTALVEKSAVPPQAPVQPIASAKTALPEPTPKSTVAATPEKAPVPTKVAAAMPAAKEELAKTSVAVETKETATVPVPTASSKRATERTPAMQAPATPPAVTDSFKGNISIERQSSRASSAPQRASVDYRTGVDYMNQGRVDQAIATFSDVLIQDPRHYAARQALVTLLLERGRIADAQRALREGLAVMPENSAWAMLLARLQVEDGDPIGATETLKQYSAPAQNRADYQAFLGTVLQMQGRHQEAIGYYEAATKLSPGYGAWLTGLAMSLEEEKRTPEAVDAYKRAYASNSLAPSMRSFVEGKLKQLQ